MDKNDSEGDPLVDEVIGHPWRWVGVVILSTILAFTVVEVAIPHLVEAQLEGRPFFTWP